jgi:hypothetical protein
MRPPLGDGLAAGAVAGVVSGLPSTTHALLTGRPLLAATRAAGNVVLPAHAHPGLLLAAGAVVHAGLSLGWGTVLAVTLPRRGAPAWGAVAGLAIAALDLGVVGRRRPLVAALPPLPQVADHVAFGAVAGVVLAARKARP